jgi:hypothetical protein
MWFDSTNRAAASFIDAVAACGAEGGHLASERDLTEAIRAGLPNGAGAGTSGSSRVYTSDFGASPTVNVVLTLSWTNVETAYTDLDTYMGTEPNLATLRPYRCTWTNELR